MSTVDFKGISVTKNVGDFGMMRLQDLRDFLAECDAAKLPADVKVFAGPSWEELTPLRSLSATEKQTIKRSP